MSFRQGYVPVPHGFCPAVNAGEIGALHPAHQFGPDLRVDDPVQIERVFGIIVKGGRHPHLGDLETGLVIEIIQLVVIVVEQIVGMPDILMRPVIQRGRAPHILEMLCDPADSLVAVLFIEKTAVALEGFVRPLLVKYADWPVRIVFIPKIQQQIQQKPAVLPAGKRNVNIVKFPENKIKPLQKRVVNILLQILPYYWKTSPFCP